MSISKYGISVGMAEKIGFSPCPMSCHMSPATEKA
jgi:hypothetical protein